MLDYNFNRNYKESVANKGNSIKASIGREIIRYKKYTDMRLVEDNTDIKGQFDVILKNTQEAIKLLITQYGVTIIAELDEYRNKDKGIDYESEKKL